MLLFTWPMSLGIRMVAMSYKSGNSAQPVSGALQRVGELLLGWGTVGVVYALCANIERTRFVLSESVLDRWVTFDPIGIWWYMSFFAFVPTAYGLVAARNLRRLRLATQWCAILSGIVFMLFPTSLPVQELPGSGYGSLLLGWLQSFDTDGNCFPSLHVALTFIGALAVNDRRRPVVSAVMWFWCLAIIYSVIQTRRHLAIDAIAGVIVALLAGCLAARCRWRRPV